MGRPLSSTEITEIEIIVRQLYDERNISTSVDSFFGNFNGKNSCKYSNKQNKLLKCKKRGKKLKKMVIIV